MTIFKRRVVFKLQAVGSAKQAAPSGRGCRWHRHAPGWCQAGTAVPTGAGQVGTPESTSRASRQAFTLALLEGSYFCS